MRPTPPALLFLSLLATSASAQTATHDELRSFVDSALAQERRLYFLKCTGAVASRREHLSHGFKGIGFFLADIPLEYAISRVRQAEKVESPELNTVAFILIGFSLYHLCRSWLHYVDYDRDRVCCRYWQEYAQGP